MRRSCHGIISGDHLNSFKKMHLAFLAPTQANIVLARFKKVWSITFSGLNGNVFPQFAGPTIIIFLYFPWPFSRASTRTFINDDLSILFLFKIWLTENYQVPSQPATYSPFAVLSCKISILVFFNHSSTSLALFSSPLFSTNSALPIFISCCSHAKANNSVLVFIFISYMIWDSSKAERHCVIKVWEEGTEEEYSPSLCGFSVRPTSVFFVTGLWCLRGSNVLQVRMVWALYNLFIFFCHIFPTTVIVVVCIGKVNDDPVVLVQKLFNAWPSLHSF